MTMITLYKYQREGGGVTVSPNKPDCDYSISYRLIADEGKLLTHDNMETFWCLDVDSVEGWYEVDEAR